MRPPERRIGYLFQNYALFPNMTVSQNILAYEPQVLLLDEPFSAMDAFLREKLRLELARVLREYEGIAIMVTHDRDEAYQLCDHLMLMNEGRILAAGSTKEIFEDPQTIAAARLTGCKNISRIERIGERKVRALDWKNLEFETAAPITDEITHIGIRAHDFEPLPAGAQERTNYIPVASADISEMPFEWYITLDNGLWWKTEKTIHTHSAEGIVPQGLRIDPTAILLLHE